MTHREWFQNLGSKPPKGKMLMARACATQSNATYVKLVGLQLVQMSIGDGAKLVRDAFQLAKEKAPCICSLTMLELLNQLDGFSSKEPYKGDCCNQSSGHSRSGPDAFRSTGQEAKKRELESCKFVVSVLPSIVVLSSHHHNQVHRKSHSPAH